MFQWKCYINLKATNISQMQSKPFLTRLRLVCVVCFKKIDSLYIHVYITKKTLKSQSWSQSNGCLHSEFAWKSLWWPMNKTFTGFWTVHFLSKGSWHGVFKLLGFSNQPSQPELNKSDISIMPKLQVLFGTYWHSSWFLKLLIKLNLYIYFINLWWLTCFKDFGSIDFSCLGYYFCFIIVSNELS